MTAQREKTRQESSGSEPTAQRISRSARLAWLAAGWICFGVGAIGVVVPGLPTTGPMLLALACFARGSKRVHQWLLNHPVFGPPIHQWYEHRVISIRAKVLAISMMLASFGYVAWLSPLPQWAVVTIGCLIGIGMVVVLCVPHQTPRHREQ